MAATTMDRGQFIQWLREEFPRLLQEDPRFAAEVVGVLSQALGSRAEFNRLLEEIGHLREDMERRFTQLHQDLDRRFEAVQQEMDRRFALMQQEMDRRFTAMQEQMDQRFAAMHEQMDRRFAAIQEQMDQRFAAIQEQMDQRFAAMQEQMDQRFAAMQEQMDQRFAAMQEQMDQRFAAMQEQMDRRFALMEQEMDRRFTAMQQDSERRFQMVLREMRRFHIALGSLGRRFGEGFEEAVRVTVEEFSGLGPLRAERLVLRDKAGELYGVPGQSVEFDAFIHDGRRFLVEVKSFAEPEDVLNFFRKVEFAKRHLDEPFEPLLVAPYASKRATQLARGLGIRLLMQEDGGSEESS